ncbi:hypothetical protein AK830_g6408 [Neonectria ditissima]|uniref:Enoyl reductase (ER) domain-containing protein n=1 Tax=Neonectria ditissima TaxID=78410 RepID=A0A0N8H6W8_9HYPO|nr:hypothetical protein AK830_g6408 [Neonectria ditissima]
MALPTSYAAYRRTTGDLPRTIEPSSETLPADLKPHDVLIKIHAVSLNYRDVAMLHGTYPGDIEERGIPCSDCAAEVVAKGSEVKDFAIGDHVSPIFDLTNLTGHEPSGPTGLGGDYAGVLRQYAIFEDNVLVQLPKNLPWEEGAMLACAGVTAWTSLNSPASALPGSSALLQGTGGVGMMALLICLAAGIQPIITSSSDEKLKAIKEISDQVQRINYKTTPDVASEVLRITNGRGVDFVVNNTGIASIPDDLKMCARRGTISLVGFLDGFKADWDPSVLITILMKSVRLQGIAVGSKEDYKNLNQFLEQKNISFAKVKDRVFLFDQSKAAFDHLYSGKHVGKIIIKVSDY